MDSQGKGVEFVMGLEILFIDFEQTFDSINRKHGEY